MDTRKAVARINPHGANTSGAGGGRPDFTDSDVTGGLGFIKNDFDREVFCALWLPAMSALSLRQFDLALRDKQAHEYVRRQRARIACRLAFHLAKEEADGTHRDLPGVRASVSHSRAEFETAQKNAWPAWERASTMPDPVHKSKYGLIRRAVLREISEPRTCTVCRGHSYTFRGALAVPCPACAATGTQPKSNRWRAGAIELSHQKFKRWSGVYLWTFLLCKRAENRAAKIMEANLKMAPC